MGGRAASQGERIAVFEKKTHTRAHAHTHTIDAPAPADMTVEKVVSAFMVGLLLRIFHTLAALMPLAPTYR